MIGKEFVRREIFELCPPELRPSVGRNLMALVRKDLILPAASADSRDDGFRFRHALIRDAAYDGLPKEIRAELHEHFAAQVEAYVGEHELELEEIIGYHLEQAVQCRVELGLLDSATMSSPCVQVRAWRPRVGGRSPAGTSPPLGSCSSAP